MSITTVQVPDAESTIALRVKDTGGEGAPVVLIHPWPQRLEIWERQETALVGGGYRVISYDRAGFGESEPSHGEAYDYDRLTQHLHGLFQALELRDATLVGWSMGGGEVARYVGSYGSERLRGIVLLAAIPPFLLNTPDNPDGPVVDAAWREANDYLASDRDGFLEMIASAFFSVNGELLVGEEIREQALAWAKTADPTAIAACQEAFSTTDFRADLAKVDVPAGIIHGDADEMVPLQYSGARAHDALPGSSLVVIEGAPHGLGITHADEVNAALLAFLREAPSRA